MLKRFSIALLIICFVSNFATAIELNYSKSDLSCTKTFGTPSFRAEYVDLKYNKDREEFYFEAKFNNSNGGTLPDSLHFVVSEEPEPFYSGKYADIFIDATNINNPKISAYAYNGQNSNLCSSQHVLSFTSSDYKNPALAPAVLFGNTSPLILFKAVSDSSANGITTRRFQLILDAGGIQAPALPCKNQIHANAPSCSWFGLKFDHVKSKAGVYLFANANSSFSYNGSGAITNMTSSSCFTCFNKEQTLNSSPECTGSTSISNPSPMPGESTSVTVEFFDKEIDELIISTLNKPTSANLSPSEGSFVRPNSTTGKTTVSLNWTPKLADVGEKSFSINALQNNGAVKAGANCSVTLDVQSLGNFANSCNGTNVAKVRDDLLAEYKSLISNTNKLYTLLKKAGRNDKTSKKIAGFKYNLVKGLLTQLPDSGYRGTCPKFCNFADSSKTRYEAKQQALQIRNIARRFGRNAMRLSPKLRSQAKKLTLSVNKLNNQIQNRSDSELPEAIYSCNF